jgi:hypothetical protein
MIFIRYYKALKVDQCRYLGFLGLETIWDT